MTDGFCVSKLVGVACVVVCRYDTTHWSVHGRGAVLSGSGEGAPVGIHGRAH